MCLEQMAGQRRSVSPTENYVHMERPCSFVRKGEIADEGRNLDLLVHRDVRIVLLPPVEIAKPCIAQRTDRGEASRTKLLAFGELLQRRHDLVAGRKNDHEGTLIVGLVDQFRLH